MRREAYALWMLPPSPGRKSPHRSSWRMNSTEAAALGAIAIIPGTTEIREIPETEEEIRKATAHYQSAGRDGAQPPKA